MEPIRVNSDDWTGLDPARAAPSEPEDLSYRRLRKAGFAFGAFGLFHLGYVTAAIDEWTDLLSPIGNLLMSFAFINLGKWNAAARRLDGE